MLARTIGLVALVAVATLVPLTTVHATVNDMTSTTGKGTLSGCGGPVTVGGEAYVVDEAAGVYAVAVGDRTTGFYFIRFKNSTYGEAFCGAAGQDLTSFALVSYDCSARSFQASASSPTFALTFTLSNGECIGNSSEPRDALRWPVFQCPTDSCDGTDLTPVEPVEPPPPGSVTICDDVVSSFCVTAIAAAVVECGETYGLDWCEGAGVGGVHVTMSPFETGQRIAGTYESDGCHSHANNGCVPVDPTPPLTDGECSQNGPSPPNSCDVTRNWGEGRRSCWFCVREELYVSVVTVAEGRLYTAGQLTADAAATGSHWEYDRSPA